MKNQGFSQSDLVISLATLSIIASVAVPSFTQNSRTVSRSDAIETLLEISMQQERFFSQYNHYSCNLVKELNRGSKLSKKGYYTISMDPTSPCPNAKSYTARATVMNSGDRKQNTICHTLSLSNLGIKSAKDTDSNDTTNQCWVN